MSGKLVILTGLPASGKDTLMNRLLASKNNLKKIVTYTDRPIRVGEVHKSDYHFVSTKKFESLIYEDYFLEYVKTGPFYKGTSKSSFKPVLEGEHVIWRIDVFRASVIEETFKEKLGPEKAKEIISRTTKILIEAGSYQEALKRFEERNPNSLKNEFHSRYIKESEIVKKNKSRFDVKLKNYDGRFDDVLSKLKEII